MSSVVIQSLILLKKMVWNEDIWDYGDLCEYKST